MPLPIVHHPHYVAPLKPDHRFPMSKYGYVRDALVARGLILDGGHTPLAPIAAEHLRLAHDAGYVERVFSLSLSDEEQRRIGLPRTERVVRRARLASAGTLLAARLALEHGIACNGAGGSHHAGPEGGAGFCTIIDQAGDAMWVWFSNNADGQGGTWGVIGGTGAYAGASGGGTSGAPTSMSPDGRSWINTSTGTITTP